MGRMIAVLTLLGLLMACGGRTPAQDIVGRWRNDGTGRELTFTADGYGLGDDDAEPYSVSADGMTLTIAGATVPLEVTGDQLTFNAITFTRVSAEVVLTEEQQKALDQEKRK